MAQCLSTTAHSRRYSPLSLASLILLVLSILYIERAIRDGIVRWPHMVTVTPTDCTLVILFWSIMLLTILRLYVEFWRIEEDQDLATALCPPAAGLFGLLVSLFEFLVRVFAIVVMYMIVNRLADTDISKIWSARSHFCSLLVLLFSLFCIWDLAAFYLMRRKADYWAKLSECPKGRIPQKWLFLIVALNDFLSFVFAVLYYHFAHGEQGELAPFFFVAFGAVVCFVCLLEFFCSFNSICELLVQGRRLAPGLDGQSMAAKARDWVWAWMVRVMVGVRGAVASLKR